MTEGREIKVWHADLAPEVAEGILKDLSSKNANNSALREQLLAVDTETTGLNFATEKLKLIQLRAGQSMEVQIVIVKDDVLPLNTYRLLSMPQITKVFHHARFDMQFMIMNNMNFTTRNVACTKVLSKLLRRDKHSLKDLLKDFLDVDISKEIEDYNWDKMNHDKYEYVANDVWHLSSLFESMWGRMPAKGFADAVMEGTFGQAWLEIEGFKNDVYTY